MNTLKPNAALTATRILCLLLLAACGGGASAGGRSAAARSEQQQAEHATCGDGRVWLVRIHHSPPSRSSSPPTPISTSPGTAYELYV